MPVFTLCQLKLTPFVITLHRVRSELCTASWDYRDSINVLFRGMLQSLLTKLLAKDQFQWTPAAQQAFDKLKTALCSVPVLGLPDFSQPFTVETDASGVGMGAVLSQQNHPIAFFSKVFSPNY